MTHFKETKYGFEFGAASVQRHISHHGYVVLGVETKRETLQIQVTPTGFIRVDRPVKRKKGK